MLNSKYTISGHDWTVMTLYYVSFDGISWARVTCSSFLNKVSTFMSECEIYLFKWILIFVKYRHHGCHLSRDLSRPLIMKTLSIDWSYDTILCWELLVSNENLLAHCFICIPNWPGTNKCNGRHGYSGRNMCPTLTTNNAVIKPCLRTFT